MQIGFNVPTTGPLIEPDSLVRIVTEGEALGFDYVTISDHIMVPRNLQSKYPYTGTGEFPAGRIVEQPQLIERGDRRRQQTARTAVGHLHRQPPAPAADADGLDSFGADLADPVAATGPRERQAWGWLMDRIAAHRALIEKEGAT